MNQDVSINFAAAFAGIAVVSIFLANDGYVAVAGGIAALGLSIASLMFVLPCTEVVVE